VLDGSRRQAHPGEWLFFLAEARAAHLDDAHLQQLERWARDVACALGPVADAAADALIDTALSRTNVVVLGELNHFVREKTDFRLWWLERISRKRRLVVAEELSWSDGEWVARYLESGNPACLARAATFGNTDSRRNDREERPTGVLRASSEAYPAAQFLAEQRRFYDGLRQWPVRFYGIDIGAPPNDRYVELEACIDRMASAADQVIAQSLLARVPGESFAAEALRLRQLRAHLGRADGLATRCTDELDAVIANLEYLEGAYSARDYEALRPAMALREAFMKRRIAHVVDGLAADEVLVLLGHAFHLTKDDASIGGVGVGPGGGLVSSLGHYLVQERGVETFAAWMVYGGGRDSQPFPDLPQIADYPRKSLNQVLANIGEPLIAPIDAAAHDVLARAVLLGHMYNQIVPINLPRAADVLWFVPHVSQLPNG
jgi:erythromycin esterase-like protein